MSTVIFVHGLWLHATSWDPWIEHFTAAGHEAHAPGWPGTLPTVEETRAHPESVGGYGIDDVVRHYADHVATLDEPVVAVGHSFGGLVVQRLLAERHVAAAVAVDPAPVRGNIVLPPSSLRVASVALRNPANFRGAVSLTPSEFAYGFGNELDEAECTELYERWTVPSPGRPLFEDAAANLVPSSPAAVDFSAERGPLLLVAGGMDHTVPASLTRTAHKLYSRNSHEVTDLVELVDRGHSLTVDHGWSEVADIAIDWIKEAGL
ncbi:alpha/beta hydrolase [Myceligenerans indicum]|uniref:Alpha/beta hydrolase n=1 Tax=Myceligenerans indicum TaxID=2593663 RepID=A0ABS1LK74_9MICO|nr:alpha/beta fold hydrolase [Myceligenerans indicum]MBL0885977.1 alpha/beta hydrolase [Myceligenerans indicum]